MKAFNKISIIIIQVFVFMSFLCLSNNSFALPVNDLRFCPPPNMGNTTSITSSTIINTLNLNASLDCLADIMEGVWDATGGLVASAGECVWSPTVCYQKAKEGFSNMKSFFSNIERELKKVWGAIGELPPSDQQELLCSLFGSIGTDVLIAVFTAGAGGAKLAATLSRLSARILLIAKMVQSYAGVPLKILGELNRHVLKSMDRLFDLGFGRELSRGLKRCL